MEITYNESYTFSRLDKTKKNHKIISIKTEV